MVCIGGPCAMYAYHLQCCQKQSCHTPLTQFEVYAMRLTMMRVTFFLGTRSVWKFPSILPLLTCHEEAGSLKSDVFAKFHFMSING